MSGKIFNALTIAGSDSGGGAGTQADLKAFSAQGVYGASVIAALTAQNTREVRGIHDVPPEFVRQQIDTVFDDIEIHAVKIGMLSRPDVIVQVAEGLAEKATCPIVLDPVMVAKSGHKLLSDDAVETLRTRLLPLADLVTPNLPEAGVLLDRQPPTNEAEMAEAAKLLLQQGAKGVLMKGGHLDTASLKDGQLVDLLVTADGVFRFTSNHITTKNTHGTGCTLSSAIAARLAKGDTMEKAVDMARRYLNRAIGAADELSVGSGHGPVHHFHALWGKD
ncbi:bifunctional hydroxymethylpyrimidine kinase/phosphomethylpyrimidine kinase [Hwanghaeella grinnelliae]|uniref:hydroxymethylpyrimidine kinase n=1 Tax=Hwanghaeella grinnelliae TaxID=2500179 RepID=A0A437QKJ6_9PROT|nr:bifunctional hydroxymethylpyrimidine kinase/phosphomethylpyrimidine kinase [Hwanghaeella grinnelliae]RVU35038.1 bifunctional hydroxymethylpyrimidine kinase/phosphomethylpyrimidine kinase [Hwanghaeella grinnelliae]